MKFHISAFTALIIFSSTTSANWFDSFNNKKNSFVSTYASTASNTPATIPESSNNNTQANLGFGISLGSKGNATTNIVSNKSTMTKISEKAKELNQTKTSTTDMFAPLDFNPSYTPITPPTVKVEHNDTTPTQDYIKLKAMWEAQRKQAEDMLKRIEEAQKSVALQP